MPQFDISTYSSQLFWLFISFGLIYVYARRFIVPFAQSIQDRRNNNVNDSVTEADKIRDSIVEIQKNYDIESKNLQNEINSIREKSTQSLNMIFQEKKNLLETETNDLKQISISEIKSIKDNFWNNKDQACKTLAESIIKKITNTEIDQELLNNCYERIK